jgi:hypothetical protein
VLLAEKETIMEEHLHMPGVLAACESPDLRNHVKQAVEGLPRALLPLQAGLSQSSYALDDPLTAVLVESAAGPDRLRLRVGLFYQGIIAGCNCADDPTPVEAQNEYCEVWLDIDRVTAAATIRLADGIPD